MGFGTDPVGGSYLLWFQSSSKWPYFSNTSCFQNRTECGFFMGFLGWIPNYGYQCEEIVVESRGGGGGGNLPFIAFAIPEFSKLWMFNQTGETLLYKFSRKRFPEEMQISCCLCFSLKPKGKQQCLLLPWEKGAASSSSSSSLLLMMMMIRRISFLCIWVFLFSQVCLGAGWSMRPAKLFALGNLLACLPACFHHFSEFGKDEGTGKRTVEGRRVVG